MEPRNIEPLIQEVETTNDLNLGLELDCPNKGTPDCGKAIKQRGRKSLNELREMVGAIKD